MLYFFYLCPYRQLSLFTRLINTTKGLALVDAPSVLEEGFLPNGDF
jgi:hypothetical protein